MKNSILPSSTTLDFSTSSHNNKRVQYYSEESDEKTKIIAHYYLDEDREKRSGELSKASRGNKTTNKLICLIAIR